MIRVATIAPEGIHDPLRSPDVDGVVGVDGAAALMSGRVVTPDPPVVS